MKPTDKNIGISAFYHDSSCCLPRNGKLIAIAPEKRFSRVKHDSNLTVRTFSFCPEKEDW